MRNVLDHFSGQLDPAPVRVWSLIVTIYGDCIMPRGGELWLGTLTTLLGAFGIEPGSVRAATSRLARDGFLERVRVGRTSHYRLSCDATAMSREAERVIYRHRAPRAEPGWQILVATGERAADRQHLAKAGFRALVPGMYVRPKTGETPTFLRSDIIRLSARGDDMALARALYPLDAIAEAYDAFANATKTLAKSAERAAPIDALAMRIALVHAFRRTVLRDPHLAQSALPKDWPADRAHEAFADLYHRLEPLSNAWLNEYGQNAGGPLPLADVSARFPDAPSRLAVNV